MVGVPARGDVIRLRRGKTKPVMPACTAAGKRMPPPGKKRGHNGLQGAVAGQSGTVSSLIRAGSGQKCADTGRKCPDSEQKESGTGRKGRGSGHPETHNLHAAGAGSTRASASGSSGPIGTSKKQKQRYPSRTCRRSPPHGKSTKEEGGGGEKEPGGF